MVAEVEIPTLNKGIIERFKHSKTWQRNVDTNPSIIAGSKTNDTAVAQRSLDGLKNFAANWVNWRTQADLLEKNVSATTCFGYSVKQTSALVRSRQQRQRTPIIRKCAQNRQTKNAVAAASAAYPTHSPLDQQRQQWQRPHQPQQQSQQWQVWWSSNWWHDQSSSSWQGRNSS